MLETVRRQSMTSNRVRLAVASESRTSMTSHPPADPVTRVAVINDFPVVMSGLRKLLATQDDIEIVEHDSAGIGPEPDVVLLDTFGRLPLLDRLDELVAGYKHVVVISNDSSPEIVGTVLDRGAAGFVHKGAPTEELVRALREAASDAAPGETGSPDEEHAQGDWPGSEHGLSARESEVLTFITQGLSNDEIAHRMYLSINSVKTYIRCAYRKVGVATRAQAVLWGVANGLHPDLGPRHDS